LNVAFLERLRFGPAVAATIRWRRLRAFDWPLTAAILAVTAFGLAMIYSATLRSPEVASLWDDLVVKQMAFAVVGLAIYAVAALTEYRVLAALWVWLYGGMLGALALVLVAGEVQLGSQRWLTLGLADLQPSEFVKVGTIVCLAMYFERFDIRKLRHVLGSLLLVLVPVVLVFVQPNLSTALLLCAIWLGMAFGAGIRVLHASLLALSSGPVLWLVLRADLLQGYHLLRISAWLNPSADPLGAGYQNTQTLIAVGNGGLFGLGYASGLQSQGGWLPMLHTDNIFALLAEELGFAGCAIALGLLAFIVQRTFRAAEEAFDPLGAHICIGVAAYILAQTLVNVGVVLQLLPVTGLSLPFISYGGSSLAALMLALGLVQSVRLRRRPLAFAR